MSSMCQAFKKPVVVQQVVVEKEGPETDTKEKVAEEEADEAVEEAEEEIASKSKSTVAMVMLRTDVAPPRMCRAELGPKVQAQMSLSCSRGQTRHKVNSPTAHADGFP
jgi:Tfp pilus assembly protein PilX